MLPQNERLRKFQEMINEGRVPLGAFENAEMLDFFDNYLKERRGAPFYLPNAGEAVVVSFSGGLDSTVTIGYLLEVLGVAVFPYYVMGDASEHQEMKGIKALSRFFAGRYKQLFRFPVMLSPGDAILRMRRLAYRYILHMPAMMILGLQYAGLLSDRLPYSVTTVVHGFTAENANDSRNATLTMQRFMTVLADFSRDRVREKAGLKHLWWQQISLPIEREIGFYVEKRTLVKLGMELSLPLELTWSCNRADSMHCGVCKSCRVRSSAWREAGISDPTKYRTDPQ